MAFRVKGTLDGSVYEVQVGGGEVAGSKRVRALLAQREGRTVRLSPGGRSYVVDPRDEESVLVMLLRDTKVKAVGEGAPDVGSPLPDGAVE